jgi:hypothetical protein
VLRRFPSEFEMTCSQAPWVAPRFSPSFTTFRPLYSTLFVDADTDDAMDEEHEKLDWGEEEPQISINQVTTKENATYEDDDDDAVSLGSEPDEREELDSYIQNRESVVMEDGNLSVSRTMSLQSVERHDEEGELAGAHEDVDRPSPAPSSPGLANQSAAPSIPSQGTRRVSGGTMTHALPPKPIAASVPYSRANNRSIGSNDHGSGPNRTGHRHPKDKRYANPPERSHNAGKSDMYAGTHEPPPTWEAKRSSDEAYYHNTEANEARWNYQSSRDGDRRDERPFSSSTDRGRVPTHRRHGGYVTEYMASASEHAQSYPPDYPDALSHSSGSRAPSLQQPSLSYDDRHYRPGQDDDEGDAQISSQQHDQGPVRSSYTGTDYEEHRDIPVEAPRGGARGTRLRSRWGVQDEQAVSRGNRLIDTVSGYDDAPPHSLRDNREWQSRDQRGGSTWNDSRNGQRNQRFPQDSNSSAFEERLNRHSVHPSVAQRTFLSRMIPLSYPRAPLASCSSRGGGRFLTTSVS